MSKKRIYRMIDGAQLCNLENQVGYCWCELHPGFLSKKLMDQHQCIERNCCSFEKFADSPYWQIKEKRKAERIAGKQRRKNLETLKNRLYDDCCIALKDTQGVAPLSVDFKNNKFIIRFVAVEGTGINAIVKNIAQKHKVKIEIQFIQNTYDFRKTLLLQVREELYDLSH